MSWQMVKYHRSTCHPVTWLECKLVNVQVQRRRFFEGGCDRIHIHNCLLEHQITTSTMRNLLGVCLSFSNIKILERHDMGAFFLSIACNYLHISSSTPRKGCLLPIVHMVKWTNDQWKTFLSSLLVPPFCLTSIVSHWDLLWQCLAKWALAWGDDCSRF